MRPKEIFTKDSKRYCTQFGNQRVNEFETLLKSARHHYFPLIPRIQDKLSWKKSALVTSEIFRLFVNTLTLDVKYSRHNMQIFWQQLQPTLSQKRKIFFDFLLHFWNSHEIENIMKKKEEYPSLIITEIIASERDVYLSV